MTELSPAAAIVKAFDDRYELLGGLEENWQEDCLAAALRAAAHHLQWRSPWPNDVEGIGIDWSISELHDIAAELEGQPND